MAEYLIQDTTLKNIGDKIRTLTGYTDTMSPDDMATNLDSAQADVLNALAAIEGKGVTVPDGTLLNGMAALIESIQAGGGNVRVKKGSVTFTEPVREYTFVEDKPDIFIAVVDCEVDYDVTYSFAQYCWVLYQDRREIELAEYMTSYGAYFGYEPISRRYYCPCVCGALTVGKVSPEDYFGIFGARTYKWYAIYGVTPE